MTPYQTIAAENVSVSPLPMAKRYIEAGERLMLAMTQYQTIAAENIREARVRRGRGAWVADKAHAAVFLSLQEFGLELFEMSPEQVQQALKSSAYTMLEFKTWPSSWLNGVLRWAIGLLAPIVWEWFLAKVKAWWDEMVKAQPEVVYVAADRASQLRAAAPGVLTWMAPLCDEARRVLEGGR